MHSFKCNKSAVTWEENRKHVHHIHFYWISKSIVKLPWPIYRPQQTPQLRPSTSILAFKCQMKKRLNVEKISFWGGLWTYDGRLSSWVGGARVVLFGGRFRKKTEAKTGDEIDEWLAVLSAALRISHFALLPKTLGKGQKRTLQTSVCIYVSLHFFHFSFITSYSTPLMEITTLTLHVLVQFNSLCSKFIHMISQPL
jgi:hypothetical protein